MAFQRVNMTYTGEPATTVLVTSETTCAIECRSAESGACEGFTYHANGTCELYNTGATLQAGAATAGRQTFRKIHLIADDSTVPCACPVGFSHCAGRCLIRPPQELTFTEAKAACVSLGAHLAVPRSAEENQCVLTMAAGADAWIGLSEHGEDGVFVAEDGGEPVFNNASFWASTEPNDDIAYNCVQMYIDSQGWDDTECGYPQGYVCQSWNKPLCG
ncbi:type-2 ice-structuring protein-like [Amphibalanus amphitrite]|uniref:type-2 ice-structuring protein-like n=1 Tax=Amphibalanus amphitrite TaxID=1232801 RepID=UPI001C91A641|nr:type-2 ice-structuring protein-like [Amphibalanus amphitrite]